MYNRLARIVGVALLWSACSADDPSVGDVSVYHAPRWYDQAAREVSDSAWSLVVLPDTQDYTRSQRALLKAQIDWIVAHREALDIRFVAHLGDIVSWDHVDQWDVARAELGRLVGETSFCLPPGNHDFYGIAKRRTSMLDAYFAWDELGPSVELGGAYQQGSIWNTYHLIDGAGGPWLMLALEFGPRAEVLQWANKVVREHPWHSVVVITHAYLYADDRRYDWDTRGREQPGNPHAYALPDVADGEEMWRNFVSRHPNIRFVLSGHATGDGVGRQTSDTGLGTDVHELLSNYQRGVVHEGQGRASSGYLRVLHFEDDDTRVDVATYSPWLNLWLNDDDNRFVLDVEPVTDHGPYSFAR